MNKSHSIGLYCIKNSILNKFCSLYSLYIFIFTKESKKKGSHVPKKQYEAAQ